MKHTMDELTVMLRELIADNGLRAVVRATRDAVSKDAASYYGMYEANHSTFALDCFNQLNNDCGKLSACLNSLELND